MAIWRWAGTGLLAHIKAGCVKRHHLETSTCKSDPNRHFSHISPEGSTVTGVALSPRSSRHVEKTLLRVAVLWQEGRLKTTMAAVKYWPVWVRSPACCLAASRAQMTVSVAACYLLFRLLFGKTSTIKGWRAGNLYSQRCRQRGLAVTRESEESSSGGGGGTVFALLAEANVQLRYIFFGHHLSWCERVIRTITVPNCWAPPVWQQTLTLQFQKN